MKISQSDIQKLKGTASGIFNQTIVVFWKLGLGKLLNHFPGVFGRSMVISFSDRGSSGFTHLPVLYYPQGDQIYCTNLNNLQPDWYLAIIANPQVEIWLPEGWFTARAEIVDAPEEKQEMLRKVFLAGGLVTQTLTNISVRKMDGDAFNEVTDNFPLLRIRRQSPRTGSDGPGSLAWLWPLITLALVLRSKRRK